mmetsp:Transcript_7191/g.8645  ORF Transcript_7191/g.8645 Transcript_7191/m.8645 type:complete len:203 (+) Transcript_7191:150-758(+)
MKLAASFLIINAMLILLVTEGTTANPAYGGLFDPLIDSSGYSVLSRIPLEDRKDLGKSTPTPSPTNSVDHDYPNDHDNSEEISFEHLSRMIHSTEKAALHALEHVEHVIEDAVRDEVSVMFHDLAPKQHHQQKRSQHDVVEVKVSGPPTKRGRRRHSQGKDSTFHHHQWKAAFLPASDNVGDEACHKFVDQETILQGFTGAL